MPGDEEDRPIGHTARRALMWIGPSVRGGRRLIRIGPSGIRHGSPDTDRPVGSRGWSVLMRLELSGANAEAVIHRIGAAPTNPPLSIGECDPPGWASTRISDADSDGTTIYQTSEHNPTLQRIGSILPRIIAHYRRVQLDCTLPLLKTRNSNCVALGGGLRCRRCCGHLPCSQAPVRGRCSITH
jgi:hypothetical protein